MRSLLTLGVITFALTFCGIGERIKGLIGGTSTNSSSSSASNSGAASSSGPAAEKPTLTASQQSIQDASTEVKWEEHDGR